jgi:predicted PurR-regulated permease PerM
LTLITIAVVNELSNAVDAIHGNLSTFLDPQTSPLSKVIGWLGQYVNIEELRSGDFLIERVKGMSGALASRALGFVGGLLGAIVQTFFVIFTMYYLFRDGERFVRAMPDMLPLKREQSERIFARAHDVIGASVYGVLVIAAIQGALGGIAFWLLGLPSAIIWAVAMTFLSMIPMAGSFLVWVPAAIYLALTGHWGKALMLAIWGTLIIGTVDNFLRPKLVGERTKLHELFIFFAVLGGLQVFGVLGIVLGPVVLAITLALLDVFRQTEKPEEEAQQEPTLVEEVATGSES